MKRLEQVEDVGWRFLRARFHQVLRSPASQATYLWQGEAQSTYAYGSKLRNDRSLLLRQQIWHKCGRIRHGSTLLPIRSVFGSHFAMGTFFCGMKGFSTKRSLATQGHRDEEDDSETDVFCESDATDILSSDEDTINKDPTKKLRASSQTQAHDDDEEDFDTAGAEGVEDELRVNSLLDITAEKLPEETGDKVRPLWMRLEEASGKQASTVEDVLDAWTAEGNPICRAVIIFTITVFRKRRRYWRALEVSDWVMTQKLFELTDMDYGIRVELIAKVQGAHKAADYFATVPKEFQTSMAYSILLTAYVEQNREKDAVNLLQKVEKLGLGHRTYMYNQLLFLYKKNGLMAGVAEVLQTMDEKNIEPDVYTYNIILDVRARKGDADGMEKAWARVQEDTNVEPDAATYAILAKGYITAGLYEKAEKVVKRVEQSPFRRRRVVNLLLLKLYGQLGKEEELERVWGLVTQGQKIGIADYVAMIRSMGKVGNAERAEDIFEEMVEKVNTPTVHHYNALLSVYASLGRTQKGESLLKKMAKASLHPNPATYHELVLMYLKAGQQNKAMEVFSKLQKASQSSIRRRPLYASFQAALEWFAEKGDVKNAEKVVRDLKNAGYLCAYRSYVVLLQAYAKGQMSPYGFLDRIRADNVIPNQHIRNELKRLDGT